MSKRRYTFIPVKYGQETIKVAVRDTDGYVFITDVYKRFGLKSVKSFFSHSRIKTLIRKVCRDHGLQNDEKNVSGVKEWREITSGPVGAGIGTWLHPAVVCLLFHWVDPIFGYIFSQEYSSFSFKKLGRGFTVVQAPTPMDDPTLNKKYSDLIYPPVTNGVELPSPSEVIVSDKPKSEPVDWTLPVMTTPALVPSTLDNDIEDLFKEAIRGDSSCDVVTKQNIFQLRFQSLKQRLDSK